MRARARRDCSTACLISMRRGASRTGVPSCPGGNPFAPRKGQCKEIKHSLRYGHYERFRHFVIFLRESPSNPPLQFHPVSNWQAVTFRTGKQAAAHLLPLPASLPSSPSLPSPPTASAASLLRDGGGGTPSPLLAPPRPFGQAPLAGEGLAAEVGGLIQPQVDLLEGSKGGGGRVRSRTSLRRTRRQRGVKRGQAS